MDDDPDKEFSQSGIPMDQREFAPEGPEYVPLPDYQGTPDSVVMGSAGQHSGKFSSKDDFLKIYDTCSKSCCCTNRLRL